MAGGRAADKPTAAENAVQRSGKAPAAPEPFIPGRGSVPKPGYDQGRVDAVRAGQAAAATAKQQERASLTARARVIYPWIPEALLPIFIDAWIETGDPNQAMLALRADPRYDEFFPGNRREDGTVRLPESELLSTLEGYDRGLRMFGQDPADFRQRYRELIEGGSSPDEFIADLAEVQQEVLLQAPSVRAFYASAGYSADVSDRAIFASRLNPGTSPQVFETRFRAAQIGAEATDRGFDYVRGGAERLAALGVSQDQARDLFSRAQSELPTLNELTARHNDPEDEFTLAEYEDAIVLRDPEHLQSIARVLSREKSMFTPSDLLDRDQAGRVTGLTQR